ncbi:head-tail connector protein [Tindallia californiensis]|uniref:head-tail connector protein n=1 Tax=Tindallia californiensis TaxID=159292 RepID=UPI002E8E16B6|nr:head-tail connector protein [Tindallia californiensis]
MEEVKEVLKITWDDEDVMLQRMIDQAKAYLQDLAGIELDFETASLEKGLLLDRCRYVYNNATEYFEENFQREILRMQLKAAANEKKEAMEND